MTCLSSNISYPVIDLDLLNGIYAYEINDEDKISNSYGCFVEHEFADERNVECNCAKNNICIDSYNFVKFNNIPSMHSANLLALTEEIVGFYYLEKNWDGFEADAISSSTIKYALSFITYMPRSFPTPEVSCSADDEIIFSWETEKGTLDITAENKGCFRAYARIINGDKIDKRHMYFSYSKFFDADSLRLSIENVNVRLGF